MALELVPLCTLRVQLKPPIEVGAGPAGTRLIFEVATAKLEGDRLNGEVTGSAAADWLVIGAEGTASLDIRVTFRTDDGAIIFGQYTGRADVSNGLEPPITIYVAPRFETGDERYAWINRIQAIGKGVVQDDLSLDYEWYEVR
ncbi:DUF3237 domain-containing protein [Pseudonocardia sichuanensis]|uniref:Uncharacterized protein DUF3237 n=1 Tax=Pseudonocardia kunmingensis TaxID=630975 RepID=A0A543DWX9_9PSEU|nr:DUF3237 domain-containing protein [Pseudonocardia kunmingensis]TQM13843.1 uncharacterized protein DUF3237 [Pseudonocardia kunmingensis]